MDNYWIATASTSLLVLLPILSLYAVSGFIRLIFRQHLSPLRQLPGPPCLSFFMGNLAEMHDQENNNLVATWEAKYGSVFLYRGFVGGCRLMTTDLRAVAHILGNAYDYPKPDFVRDSLASMAVGHNGLLTVEGEQHRKQRKILAPAFSSVSIRAITPVFWEKAKLLRDIWLRKAEQQQQQQPCRVDALAWLGRATLDAIGLAGFGYVFNSLSEEENELASAFGVIFSTARKFRVMTILQVWFPFLRKYRKENSTMAQATATMRRIGLQLIEERKTAIISQIKNETKGDAVSTDGDVHNTMLGRDLLSVLIRSNMSTIESQRMNMEEILCQISTFLAAGHETTSSALTWVLYALSQSPLEQRNLRTELLSLDPDAPTLEADLLGLPYLDWVVREALRVHAPVTTTMRVAAKDDRIPVLKPFVDKTGAVRTSIPVKKHDIISIPIQAINKSQAIWGADAQVFRPERWREPPEAAKTVPGLYSNILTFLNGNASNGNRACIGYKFALTEIKIFLYVLLCDMEFGIDPALVIEKRVNVVTRPIVQSEPHLGNQMPLYIRRVDDDPSGPWPPPPAQEANWPQPAPPPSDAHTSSANTVV